MSGLEEKPSDKPVAQDASSWVGCCVQWLEERLPVAGALELMDKKTVPMHRHSIWYYLGGMALFLFGIQAGTGILLLLYYQPTAEAAFESVQFITTDVQFGWLMRSIHSWSANLMVLVVFVHLFSTLLLKAYRKPRELTWVTGVGLLGLSLCFGFSGYLLPWNGLAFFATKVGTELVNDVPVIGHWLLIYLRGGEEVTGATLTRFFGFHVAVLPMFSIVVLGLHLLLVQHHGMSTPPSIERELGGKKGPVMPFFPSFILRDTLGWLVALGLLAALAALFPWELGVKADPFESAPAGIRPEWYFLFSFETLKLFPSTILGIEGEFLAIVFFGILGVLLLVVPFIDVWTQRGHRSPLFTVGAIVAIIYIAGMTLYSYLH